MAEGPWEEKEVDLLGMVNPVRGDEQEDRQYPSLEGIC